MEKISISAYSAQLRLFSSSADPPKLKPPDTSSGTSSNPLSRSSDLQSQDGDTFSMSLEARIVQISMTRTDDGATIAGKGSNGSQVNGLPGNDAQGNGVFGSGLVKALMQALGGFLGNDTAAIGGTADATTESGPAAQVDQAVVQSRGRKGHHHYGHHPMGNPEDVASKVLQHLQQEHAQKGGSLQAFVDEIQKRMENRLEARSSKTDGSNGFRAQVDSLIQSGLTAWAQTGGQALDTQA